MHIIITTRSLPFHTIGGLEVITWDLATEFVRKGCRVTCLTTHIVDKEEKFSAMGVNVIALKGTDSGVYSRSWWKKSKKFIEENFIEDCDVLLSVSASGYSVVSLKPKMKNTVFVFQAHGTSLSEIASKIRIKSIKSLLTIPVNLKWLFVDLFMYQKFDGLVAAGDRVHEDFTGWFYPFFLKNKKICSISNGINLNVFKHSIEKRQSIRRKLGIDDDAFVVLIASRLHKQKGVEKAIKAFYEFHSGDKRSHLMVLGNGPEENNIACLIRSLKIDSNVHVLGAVSVDRLPQYINASDVYLFTTLHEEGLPLLPLEVLAAGVPAIVSKHLKEVVECCDFVIPVDPQNINSIVDGLLTSQKNKFSGESLLPEKYSLNLCARNYLNFFKDVLV